MRPEEALRAAAQFIRVGGLSQGANARDENGREVPLWSTGSSETGRAVPNPAGVRFSIYGAIVKAIHSSSEGVRRQTLMFDVAFMVASQWLDQEAAGATGGTNRVHAVDQVSDTPGRTSEDAARFLEECANEAALIGDGPYQPPIDPKAGQSLQNVVMQDGEIGPLTELYGKDASEEAAE